MGRISETIFNLRVTTVKISEKLIESGRAKNYKHSLEIILKTNKPCGFTSQDLQKNYNQFRKFKQSIKF